MPIYAYRCASCGHAKDVLQKFSDPLLTTCPSCGAEAFQKQLTAAGFQLKGSGWYVTDFKGGPPAAKADAVKADAPKAADAAEPAAKTSGEASPAAAAPAQSDAPAPAASATTGAAGGPPSGAQ
jgi:putative FmdB family regulatory protein